MLSEQIHNEVCLWERPLMVRAIILNQQVPGGRVSQNRWSSQPTLPTGFAIFQRNRIIEDKPRKKFGPKSNCTFLYYEALKIKNLFFVDVENKFAIGKTFLYAVYGGEIVLIPPIQPRHPCPHPLSPLLVPTPCPNPQENKLQETEASINQ